MFSTSTPFIFPTPRQRDEEQVQPEHSEHYQNEEPQSGPPEQHGVSAGTEAAEHTARERGCGAEQDAGESEGESVEDDLNEDSSMEDASHEAIGNELMAMYGALASPRAASGRQVPSF